MYEVFEELLKTHNVTAYRVAKETGISTGTLTDWKMGRSTPKRDKLKLLADYFGVNLEYLTGEDVEEKYVIDEESKERLEVLKVNENLRILFDSAKKLEPDDIKFVLDMVERMNRDKE
jgi:transcriptional regulator with XRE-family HTH domain